MIKRYRLYSFPILLSLLLLIISSSRATFAGDAERSGIRESDAYYWTYFNIPKMSNEERMAFARKMMNNSRQFSVEQMKRVQEISTVLEGYIRNWLKGEAGAKIPRGVLPEDLDNFKTRDWTLQKSNEIDPYKQWYYIPARDLPLDMKHLYQHSADPHVTYLKCIFIAPFGSTLLVEGDFPHCRFMDFQILQPFDPLHPTLTMGEIPIVDVDIEPDKGHTNPFRVGADRTAKKRHYHVRFTLMAGNAVKMNPEAMEAPTFRAPGNKRVGGPFGSTGALGRGAIVPSVLWLRYYAPDTDKGPLAGVQLPRVTLKLKTGEEFWLQCDYSMHKKRFLKTFPALRIPAIEPVPIIGPDLGWFKMFGIVESQLEARGLQKAQPWGDIPERQMKNYIRATQRLLLRRGPDVTPPGNLENAATCVPYNSYLVRPLVLGKGKVYVLTGKLPTFPATRNGERTMTKAQVRYWSIHHSTLGLNFGKKYRFLVNGGIMDDEIVLNRDRTYTIVLSRAEERPKNARPECGVTWEDFGPSSRQVLVLRWQSVRPDWYLPRYNPHSDTIPWGKGVWSSENYDPDLIGKNRPGILGPYHPVIHYMTKEEFEDLGENISPDRVPKWE